MWGKERLLNEGSFTFYKNVFFCKHAFLKPLADDTHMTGLTRNSMERTFSTST